MEATDFAALREDERDRRLAEFLNQQARKEYVPPYAIGFFAMTINFRKIPVGQRDAPNVFSHIAWLQEQGRTLATARRRDDVWVPATTPLDVARKIQSDVLVSAQTEEHARQTAMRLRERLYEVLPEIGFDPKEGDKVICLHPHAFGWEGRVIEIFPPTATMNWRRTIYTIQLVGRDGRDAGQISTSNVLPPSTVENLLPYPKESTDVG